MNTPIHEHRDGSDSSSGWIALVFVLLALLTIGLLVFQRVDLPVEDLPEEDIDINVDFPDTETEPSY